MSLSVRLRHRFPSVQMDMAFEVPTPGVTVLFGPSGVRQVHDHFGCRRTAAAG